ncbi:MULTISPECIES: glutathione peroxidase [Paenibacillus]|uniref:Glutathione peroxidase n=1 Tax=Paenibacillus naphthalenovorans TaxID=162209 RepID=A0A0U2U888_9BACL|nr:MULTISPECIES: glutathione peroxidase [Paenibacillus]ALS22408.1 glutathione peroxidase [Paenibacillus naphthalenovorans]NTZ16861.1 glutathione peroxidase [Paenibacillus sp. JMULE4]GCL70196.1 glutathione peroxidase [Paenibacillus naphthalenovorans]SDH89206.1 glutathione peroxidase [Paenibacillus naphthalenovorans]
MSVYDFSAKTIDGTEKSLADYKGKVLLIVNTASACGLTPHYKGLQALYDKYKDQGLVVLGFPCNQFGGQEPGTEEEIKSFCELKYQVTFPMFAKIDVKGENAHPLYTYLVNNVPADSRTGDIEWNFVKFLVNRDGEPVKQFSARTEPEALEEDIKALLSK